MCVIAENNESFQQSNQTSLPRIWLGLLVRESGLVGRTRGIDAEMGGGAQLALVVVAGAAAEPQQRVRGRRKRGGQAAPRAMAAVAAPAAVRGVLERVRMGGNTNEMVSNLDYRVICFIQ